MDFSKFPVAFGRNGEPRGAGPGGARLQDALPGRVPQLLARAHALLLEEGPGGEAYVRVPAGLPRGLLHLHRTPVSARGEPIEPPTGGGAGGKNLNTARSALTDLRGNACERIRACESHAGGTRGSSVEAKTKKAKAPR